MAPLVPWQLTSTLPGPSSPHHSFALPSLQNPSPQSPKRSQFAHDFGEDPYIEHRYYGFEEMPEKVD